MSALGQNATELHSYSDELRRQEEFCDVVIKVQDQRFPCHRIILASAVKYFRNMFTQNYSETDKKEIELKGFNADDFELLLTHIYGGSVDLNDNNAYRLLRISHYLNLKSLEDSCAEYLMNSESIPLNSAICIFLFACRIGGTPLADEFTKRMAENFVALSKNEKFLRISGAELQKILSHPNLSSDSTSTLDCLTNWMKFQSDENRNFLPDLLNTIHLDNVPNEWLAKTIRENTGRSNTFIDKKRKKKERKNDSAKGIRPALFRGDSAVDQLFFDVEMDDIEITYAQNEIALPFVLYTHDVRNGNEYFINRYKFDSVSSVRLMNTDRDPKLEYEKVEFCKSAVVDKVHMMIMINRQPFHRDDQESSGYTSSSDSDSNSSLSSFRRSSVCKFTFNPYFYYKSDIHALKSCHETSRNNYSCSAMTARGSKIYLYSTGKFRTFDCQNNEWIHGPRDVPVETSYPCLLSSNDSLYMVGGKRTHPRPDRYASTNYRNGKFFQHYDVREGKWSRLPRMKYSHNRAACCIHDDVLYVSGGAYLTYFKGYIECFDFKAGKWGVFETSMPKPKMNHTLIAYDNKLWFFGGENYKSGTSEIVPDLSWYSYDLKEHSWSETFFLPKTRRNFTTLKIFDVVVGL